MKNTGKEIEQENKKTGVFKSLLNKVTDIKRSAVEKAHENALAKADKKRTDAYFKQLERYNPVYEDVYKGGFYMPNLLIIEDDTRRNEAEVLNCAMGWVEKENGAEVFHLFEDCVQLSSLKLLPNAQSGGLYCVDGFDKNVYMRVECIFDIVRDEKLAELKHVAQSLGAKSCTVEITKSSASVQASKKNVEHSNAQIDNERGTTSKEFSSGKVSVQFEGSDVVKRPTLKWFANDSNIQKLIESRCSGENAVKSEMIELKGTTYAAMSRRTACSIDNLVSKLGGGMSMESQAVNESENNLIFVVEF